MTTAFLIIFSLLIEYIYDPISNMKDTHVMQSLIEKYKEYFKDYFNNKYVLYLFFAVLIFILINILWGCVTCGFISFQMWIRCK